MIVLRIDEERWTLPEQVSSFIPAEGTVVHLDAATDESFHWHGVHDADGYMVRQEWLHRGGRQTCEYSA